jgi:hypothetical protein
MRIQNSVTLPAADALVTRIKRGASAIAQRNGSDVACLFVVHRQGYLGFSAPQASSARLGMTAAQIDAEKADLIHRLIVGGRRGGPADADEYGGDNKAQRLHDHRFDWTFQRLTP